MIELTGTLVVNLDDDVERRAHVAEHFRVVGVENFRFWPAVRHDDEAVAAMYGNGRVAAFPPCFRCGRADCNCSNNILLPQQVANWLSFLSLWRSLPDDPDRYYLVCEDDVAFHENALYVLTEFMRSFVADRHHVLVRMARSGEPPFLGLERAAPVVSHRAVMSNAAYMLNGSMAALLARSSDRITTTADIWVHRTMAALPTVQALTLEPLLATELSYNKEHARFVSRIHPKGIDDADLERQRAHKQRATSAAHYEQLVRQWSTFGG
jgi:GR25 family glycosyltransferase involved in LPS biosynthesis